MAVWLREVSVVAGWVGGSLSVVFGANYFVDVPVITVITVLELIHPQANTPNHPQPNHSLITQEMSDTVMSPATCAQL